MTHSFHPTRWTLVLRSRGQGEDAKAALSDLCAVYYEPVVGFLKRDGRDEDAAREAAHAFFEFVLARGIGTPDQERGKFRSYLLGALKHFLAKHREAARTAKRGGRIEHVPLVAESDTSPGIPVPGTPDDELTFDRDWALALIARALSSLEQEYAHKADFFRTLKPWLDGSSIASQADAAAVLGMNETAVKVAIHRLRARFRELIRSEVAATVNDPSEVAEELRHLISVASQG